MMSLEQIINDLVWVVKLNEGGRVTGTYKEVEHLMDDCRDMDLVVKQPTNELQDFVDALFNYKSWITVQDFYPIYVQEKKSL